MHEVAIAESVVRAAAERAGGARVTKVELKVGHLRQVVPSALTLGFGLVAQGTPVEGAELNIEEVPARGLCRECGAESRLAALPLICLRCGSREVEVIGGEELLVEALELEEPVL